MADEGSVEDFQRMASEVLSAKQPEEPTDEGPPAAPPPVSREYIAERHGTPQLAPKLVGTTAEELEADAAAKAALLQVFQVPAQKQAINEAVVRMVHGEDES